MTPPLSPTSEVASNKTNTKMALFLDFFLIACLCSSSSGLHPLCLSLSFWSSGPPFSSLSFWSLQGQVQRLHSFKMVQEACCPVSDFSLPCPHWLGLNSGAFDWKGGLVSPFISPQREREQHIRCFSGRGRKESMDELSWGSLPRMADSAKVPKTTTSSQ